MKTFKTEKGTELQLLNLKGKFYLPVQGRVLWFREVYPQWSIETEVIERNEKFVICKAVLKNDAGRVMATAHKREDFQHFADATEKAETSAIGRALALCGFGTQFALDLDEEERIVDSPVERHRGVSTQTQVNTPRLPEFQEPAAFQPASKTPKPRTQEILELIASPQVKGWSREIVKSVIQSHYKAERMDDLTDMDFVALRAMIQTRSGTDVMMEGVK